MQYSRVQGYDKGMLYFLNEASDALFSSLTMEDDLVFDRISHLIVPHLADWFAIDVINPDRKSLKLLTLAHKDPAKIRLGYELRRKYPPDLDSEIGLAAVLRNGVAEMYQEITDEMLRGTARDKRHFELLSSIGFQSVIIVPMKSRNVPFGTITFVSTRESGKVYSQDDLLLIENFANKVAIAVDNHRLYKTAQNEITRSKKIEEEIINLLQESKMKQEWLDSLIRTIPGIVWETKLNNDNTQQLTFVSRYAEEMLGYSRDQLLSLNFWWSIIHPDDLGDMETTSKRTYRKGFGQHQYRMITKDGKVLWAEARSQVLYDEGGNPRGMRGITFDITRMKELETRKDEFISIASHELKTPITSAKLIVQILNEYSGGLPEEKFFAKKLDDQLDKLTVLINSMLDVNRLQAGGIDYKNELFDLNSLVNEIIEDFRIATPHPIVSHGHVPYKINADKERIGQVLINLLTNAIKYSDKDKKVDIYLSATEEAILVKVKDEGIGIEEKYREKVFEKFFRIPDPQIKFISGMGIGLNIAHQIISFYKGKIWVESNPGNGSLFCFSLPASLRAS